MPHSPAIGQLMQSSVELQYAYCQSRMSGGSCCCQYATEQATGLKLDAEVVREDSLDEVGEVAEAKAGASRGSHH